MSQGAERRWTIAMRMSGAKVKRAENEIKPEHKWKRRVWGRKKERRKN